MRKYPLPLRRTSTSRQSLYNKPMNITEQFMLQMALTYMGLVLSTNKTLTAEQTASLEAFIASGQQVGLAFSKT